MPASETSETIPMVAGADDVIRVSGTRVTLDSILLAFNEGATPEEIASNGARADRRALFAIIGLANRLVAPPAPASSSTHLLS